MTTTPPRVPSRAIDAARALPEFQARKVTAHDIRRTADAMLASAPAKGFVPEVESLRGLAILMVVLHHLDGMLTAKLAAGGHAVGLLRAFVAGGQTGVSLFFVLSAFCLSLPIFPAATRGERFSTMSFHRRRVLRIIPAYWTAIVVGTVLTSASTADLGRATAWMVFANSFSQVAAPIPPFSAVWWSLATEAQFYVLLPLLPYCLASRRGRRIGAAAVLLYSAAFVEYLFSAWPLGTTTAELSLSHSVLALAPIFMTGVLAAALYASHGPALRLRLAQSRLLSRGGADLLLLASLFGLGTLLRWLVWFGYYRAEQRAYFGWHVIEGLCWGSVLLLLLLAPLRSYRLFCNRALAAVGRWSYSLYLVHLPVMVYTFHWLRLWRPGVFLTWNVQTLAVAAAVVVMSVALSALTYRFIEKPFLDRKKRIGAAAPVRERPVRPLSPATA
ncbi:MAG TPA: acyltransferase [Candidatus Binatia bacterium]|jgi:peptidoglycan/LPS O-acetylase OafA/YrhL